MTAISSTLRDSAFVGCSAQDAHRYLRAHFGGQHGVTPKLLLRVPVADLGLDHPVVISLSDLPSRSGEYVMEVGWSADGGGPYPTFIGSLACLASSPKGSHIELEGAYTIPGGIAGQAFDAAIGHRIAAAAARSLMETLAGIVDAAAQRDHAAHGV